MALRVLLVWIYNNTGRSVFATALCHASVDVSAFVFPNYGSHYDPRFVAPITVVAAIVVTLLWGSRTLTGEGGESGTAPCDRHEREDRRAIRARWNARCGIRRRRSGRPGGCGGAPRPGSSSARHTTHRRVALDRCRRRDHRTIACGECSYWGASKARSGRDIRAPPGAAAGRPIGSRDLGGG